MFRVAVSPEARRDLISILQYIENELCNPPAAKRMMKELKKGIQALQHFPERGKPLDALIPVHTEYRYLVCENDCVFYLSSEKDVLIIRILHQRQDCLKALFISN